MSHLVEQKGDELVCRYAWRRNRREEFVCARASGAPALVLPGSIEEFITEHYWGYNARRGRSTEYQVEHPPWRVWEAKEAQFEADVGSLYGPGFAQLLSEPPASAFIAEGSPVLVRRGSPLVVSAAASR